MGVGASAGGLEAFQQLLQAVPRDTGVAFVLVQHLAPKHESLLPEILSRTSAIPVSQATDQVRIEPDHAYVIPPAHELEISDGVLALRPRPAADGGPRVIDHFLRSLAAALGPRSIGVILSGTGSDGTVGLEEIKAAGGITFAQDDSAQQAGMPRHAVAAGCVDFVLAPADIAREIAHVARHPLVGAGATDASEQILRDAEIGRILALLHEHTEVDFSGYKRNTLNRRIARRMVLHKLSGLKEYVALLRSTPAELDALFNDVLISVTSFFRNPESFEALRKRVLPRLTDDRSRNDPIRIWVQGCSTGEEAYSLAIMLTEFGEQLGRVVPFQVFATDLNSGGIEKARAGVYSRSIVEDVSQDRLRRFFTDADGSFRISKIIRDRCIFAQHNLLAAPPFSHIDLISCRNLLIYLDAATQQRLMPILHYALKSRGFLWLGNSESVGGFGDLFELEDSRHKIYAKRAGAVRPAIPVVRPERGAVPRRRPPAQPAAVPVTFEPQRELDRLLLARYAPPAVLVGADLDVLQFRGDTGRFLSPAPGKASLNLMSLLREGLLVPVRTAINKAKRTGVVVREEGVRLRIDAGIQRVSVEVIPVQPGRAGAGGFLVIFEGKDDVGVHGPPASRAPAKRRKDEIEQLTGELAATREYLQSVIEHQEAANEELQSANEEVQSANEELQSINEELSTSKEEIQSSNEELATVNDELAQRNQELTQTNDDMVNLLASAHMAIVIMDAGLRIRRFTPMAEKLLSILPTDIGRPITDIRLNLGPVDVAEVLRLVIESASPRDLAVQDPAGRWFSLRARPYRTADNRIDGAVMVLVDIDVMKHEEEELRRLEGESRGKVDALVVLDKNRNDFLSALAHELRTPLAALRNIAQVLHQPGSIEKTRELMNRQVQSMARMIDDLLDVAKIAEGTIAMRLVPVQIRTLLLRTLETVQARLDLRGQRITVNLSGEEARVLADEGRLEQTLGKLLINASKFAPPAGQLWITSEVVTRPSRPAPADGPDVAFPQVVIRIRDDGAGTGPATLPLVFDLFAHVEHSPEAVEGGLGVGLSLVRRVLELHNGSVDARSAGIGMGSEFVVRLPTLPPRPAGKGK